MRYSPEPLSNSKEARQTAEDFGALFRYVLCSTLAPEAYVRVVQPSPAPRNWQDARWQLSQIGHGGVPVPVRLMDGSYLFAAQTLGVRESRRSGSLWLTTLQASYSWQADGTDDSWIVRWDYVRDRQPECHLHVNADPPHYPGTTGKPFRRLHLPTARVGVEDVVEFLIRDAQVGHHRDDWEDVIAEAREIFARIQGRG